MAAKQVTYHRDAPYEPLVLDVLKERSDGTVDIGKDGKALVTSCPIVDVPKPGYCTVIVPVQASGDQKPPTQ